MLKQRLLIKNAHIINAAKRCYDEFELLISSTENNSYQIERIAQTIDDITARSINCSGLYITPAFIDLWSHIGDIGYEYRETYATGTNAAVCGGFGYVTVAPTGKKVTDSPQILERRLIDAENMGKCRVGFCGALTKGIGGKEICDYSAMKALGAVAFSDGKHESMGDDLLYLSMDQIAKADSLFIAHPRYHSCYKGGSVNRGRISRILGVSGIPTSAEALDVARYLLFAAETGCRLHICGISCEPSIELIANAKHKGINVTASTSPQYFSFCEDDILFYGARARVWPPLRTRRDVNAVIEALSNGTLDCITSDHTPLAKEEKGSDFKNSTDGTIGLQTAFSAGNTYLVTPGKLDIFRLVDLMYSSPAKILGIDHLINEGTAANLNIVSLDREFIVTNNYLKSRSSNSIFMGLNLRGCVDSSYISN